MSAPENPFAFACVTEQHLQEGMTLRDYFAGQALAGMLADYQCNPQPAEAAQVAYGYADAMLADRAATLARSREE